MFDDRLIAFIFADGMNIELVTTRVSRARISEAPDLPRPDFSGARKTGRGQLGERDSHRHAVYDQPLHVDHAHARPGCALRYLTSQFNPGSDPIVADRDQMPRDEAGPAVQPQSFPDRLLRG